MKRLNVGNILLKEKELIKNGDFSSATIDKLDDIVSTTIEAKKDDETGITYNIYTITSNGLKKLNVKGNYGNP